MNWCLRQQIELSHRIEMLESGAMTMYERDGAGRLIDTTGRSIEQDRRALGELDALLAKRSKMRSD